MSKWTIIARSYALFCALCLTFTFSCGLSGILYPRSYMPEDPFVGLFIIGYSLPLAILFWREAIWYKSSI